MSVPSVDWDQPLEAVAVRGPERVFAVRVDGQYNRTPDRIPVKFHVNLWTGHDSPGTWYFDPLGLPVAGQGMFVVRNATRKEESAQ